MEYLKNGRQINSGADCGKSAVSRLYICRLEGKAFVTEVKINSLVLFNKCILFLCKCRLWDKLLLMQLRIYPLHLYEMLFKMETEPGQPVAQCGQKFLEGLYAEFFDKIENKIKSDNGLILYSTGENAAGQSRFKSIAAAGLSGNNDQEIELTSPSAFYLVKYLFSRKKILASHAVLKNKIYLPSMQNREMRNDYYRYQTESEAYFKKIRARIKGKDFENNELNLLILCDMLIYHATTGSNGGYENIEKLINNFSLNSYLDKNGISVFEKIEDIKRRLDPNKKGLTINNLKIILNEMEEQHDFKQIKNPDPVAKPAN